MGTILSVPASFVALTKARASEVNAKFTDIYNALAGASYDSVLNGIRNNRLSNGDVAITSGGCYINAFHAIDSTATYSLRDTTSRMVVFGALTVHGTLDITSGALALVL